MTVLLAFDTATEQRSIGLSVHGRVTVHEAPGGALASAALIPAVLGLLAQAGITLNQLDATASALQDAKQNLDKPCPT